MTMTLTGLDEALSFARAYAHLGGAVQSQLEDLVSNEQEVGDCNPNALAIIARFLHDEGFGDDLLADDIAAHLKTLKG